MKLLSTVTAINVLVAAGFSVASLLAPAVILPPGAVVTGGTMIFSLYAAARTVPLAVITLIVIVKQSRVALLILATLAGFIQLLDAGIGLYQHDWSKTLGPLFISLLQLWVVSHAQKSSAGPGPESFSPV